VVEAASEDEIVEIVRIAHAHKVPLFPTSTGNNWGYGTANPARDGCVLISMGAMRNIGIENADLGVISVEPGVTQGQLSAFLHTHNLPFLTPTTGAGPDCSVLANALERGYGITPMIDHFASVMALRAVLVDGRVYTSPLEAVGAHASNGLFKWGFGPYWDGLFAQGNLGIVTKMHIALVRRPARIAMLSFSSQDSGPLTHRIDQIEALADATHEVMARLSGTVASINLMNQRRVLAVADADRNPAAPHVYDETIIAEMGKRLSVAAWTGVGSLYGEPEMVRAAKQVIKRQIGPHAKRLVFVTENTLSVARRASALLPERVRAPVQRVADALGKGLDILHGEPNRVAHGALYWALRRPFDADKHTNPANEGVGLLWYVPLIPARGVEAREFVREMQTICLEHDFEPLITLTALSERCFDSSVPIVFDATDPNRTAAAHRCYETLLRAGLARGIAPYRFGAQATEVMFPQQAVFAQLGVSLRSSADPHRVLAPGRYEVLS
jgi:FAD/FMN-containing dehydrogenase